MIFGPPCHSPVARFHLADPDSLRIWVGLPTFAVCTDPARFVFRPTVLEHCPLTIPCCSLVAYEIISTYFRIAERISAAILFLFADKTRL